MNSKRHMTHLKLSGLAAIILIAVATGSASALTLNQAQPEPPLADLALHSYELPKGSEWKGSGSTNADDVTQPLNKTNGIGLAGQASELLSQYEEAYKAGAVVAIDSKYGAYVGSYVYRYPDSSQAEAAAKALIDSVLQTHQGELLPGESRAIDGGVHGRAAMFVGSEGDAIYWFAGVKGRALILLMVNGMDSASTTATFESLAALMMKR